MALLCDHVNTKNETLQIGAILGLGLAYTASNRNDVNELLTLSLLNETSKIKEKKLWFVNFTFTC